MKKYNRGSTPLSRDEKESLVRAIEPYLKAGLSIRKACNQSGVNRSTLYKIMEQHHDLADQITRAQMYLEILTMGAITKQMMDIVHKQQQNIELNSDELRYLMWFATNSRFTQEEFGKHAVSQPTVDPHIQLMKLMRRIDTYCLN